MAELDVKERQAGDVTILDMSGEVRIGEGSIALRDSVRNLAAAGRGRASRRATASTTSRSAPPAPRP